MLDISLKPPKEIRLGIAARTKGCRLDQNISQQELAKRSGVSLGSIKRFESSGLIALSAWLEIALVLGRLADFENLFAPSEEPVSLFKSEPKKRKRSSRKKNEPN